MSGLWKIFKVFRNKHRLNTMLLPLGRFCSRRHSFSQKMLCMNDTIRSLVVSFCGKVRYECELPELQTKRASLTDISNLRRRMENC